ncbi:MAG TPA: DUF2490 domain-containing protein, partial [Puia sp.]|nr:DUF2490 domain-containing protein [Puia sp.]
MKALILKSSLLIVFLFSSHMILAQDSSVQKQIWPELEAYYRINERFRLYSLISGTRSNSEYTDGTAGIYIDYFASPWLRGRNDTELSDLSKGYFWWFRIGYSYSDAPPSDKKKIVNIFETETNNSFHLPEDIILQTKNRLDWRWVNGEFQPIYRPRVKLVRNLKTEYLTFNAYLWSEYFFYLNDNTQDRLRLTLGIEIKVLRFM